MEIIPKSVTTFYDNYFNPFKDHIVENEKSEKINRDIPFGTNLIFLTVGIGSISASFMSTPPRFKNAVCLTGLSVTTAGLTRKQGYVLLPAILWMTYGVCDCFGKPISSFFQRNISPLTTLNNVPRQQKL